MATQVQNRRGTTAEHTTFTGAVGELTVDTTKDTVVVHDGAVAGGRPLLREDQSNLPTSAPTTGIYNASGSLAISTGGSGRLFVDASGNVGIADSTPQRDAGTTSLAIGDGSKSASVDLYGTAKNYAIYNGGSGQLGVFDLSASTERITLTSAGLVGVGTSLPGYALDTVASSGSAVAARFRGNGGANNNTQIRFYGNNAATDQWAIGGSIATSDTGRDFHIYDLVANANRLAIDSSGRLLVGTSSDSGGALLQVNGDRIRVGTAKTPASATATGTAGEICWDASYVYVCTATNTWKRSALSTW